MAFLSVFTVRAMRCIQRFSQRSGSESPWESLSACRFSSRRSPTARSAISLSKSRDEFTPLHCCTVYDDVSYPFVFLLRSRSTILDVKRFYVLKNLCYMYLYILNVLKLNFAKKKNVAIVATCSDTESSNWKNIGRNSSEVISFVICASINRNSRMFNICLLYLII